MGHQSRGSGTVKLRHTCWWCCNSSTGTFTWDRETGSKAPGSARAAKVSNGCFIQVYTVKPGEKYAVSGLTRVQGRGGSWLRIRWQTPEAKWTLQDRDIIVPPQAGEGWQPFFGVAEVPEGVGKLVILLGVGGQHTDADVAWFDDVHVNRLD